MSVSPTGASHEFVFGSIPHVIPILLVVSACILLPMLVKRFGSAVVRDRVALSFSCSPSGSTRSSTRRTGSSSAAPPVGEDRIVWGDYTLNHGYCAAKQFLQERRKFDALLCGEDIVAFDAMAALKANGIRISERLAVVGFDNDLRAPVFDPSLTTIHVPMHEMGKACFALFRKIAARKEPPLHVSLVTRLVALRSTYATCREYQYLEGNP